LARFQGSYPLLEAQGVTVLGLAMFGRLGPPAVLSRYRKDMGIRFPLLYNGPPDGYIAWGSPAVAVLNRQGELVAYRRGGEANWASDAFPVLMQRLGAAAPSDSEPHPDTRGGHQSP